MIFASENVAAQTIEDLKSIPMEFDSYQCYIDEFGAVVCDQYCYYDENTAWICENPCYVNSDGVSMCGGFSYSDVDYPGELFYEPLCSFNESGLCVYSDGCYRDSTGFFECPYYEPEQGYTPQIDTSMLENLKTIPTEFASYQCYIDEFGNVVCDNYCYYDDFGTWICEDPCYIDSSGNNLCGGFSYSDVDYPGELFYEDVCIIDESDYCVYPDGCYLDPLGYYDCQYTGPDLAYLQQVDTSMLENLKTIPPEFASYQCYIDIYGDVVCDNYCYYDENNSWICENPCYVNSDGVSMCGGFSYSDVDYPGELFYEDVCFQEDESDYCVYSDGCFRDSSGYIECPYYDQYYDDYVPQVNLDISETFSYQSLRAIPPEFVENECYIDEFGNVVCDNYCYYDEGNYWICGEDCYTGASGNEHCGGFWYTDVDYPGDYFYEDICITDEFGNCVYSDGCYTDYYGNFYCEKEECYVDEYGDRYCPYCYADRSGIGEMCDEDYMGPSDPSDDYNYPYFQEYGYEIAETKPTNCSNYATSDQISDRTFYGTEKYDIFVQLNSIRNFNPTLGTYDLDLTINQKPTFRDMDLSIDYPPKLHFINGIVGEQSEEYCTNLSYSYRVQGKFSTILDFRQYPFETMDIIFTIDPGHLNDTVSFENAYLAFRDKTGVQIVGYKTTGTSNYTNFIPYAADEDLLKQYLPIEIVNEYIGKIKKNETIDDNLKQIIANYLPFDPTFNLGYTQYVGVVEVQAYPHQAFLKIIMPVIIITGISTIPFWMDPKDIGTKIALAVGSLLTMVFFIMETTSDLPALPYLTIADKTNLTAYAVILYSIMSTVIVKRKLFENDLPYVIKLNKKLRWLLPIIVAGVAIPLFLLLPYFEL